MTIDTRIFLPVLGMVLLTFIVWWRMFFMRIGQMKREHISPQKVAMSAQVAALLTDSRAADNFRNLFELPVLFYAAVCIAALSGQVNVVTLTLAWIFVALRCAHSAIQCSYNRVMHRFYAYIGGGVALFALWGVLAFGLLR